MNRNETPMWTEHTQLKYSINFIGIHFIRLKSIQFVCYTQNFLFWQRSGCCLCECNIYFLLGNSIQMCYWLWNLGRDECQTKRPNLLSRLCMFASMLCVGGCLRYENSAPRLLVVFTCCDPFWLVFVKHFTYLLFPSLLCLSMPSLSHPLYRFTWQAKHVIEIFRFVAVELFSISRRSLRRFFAIDCAIQFVVNQSIFGMEAAVAAAFFSLFRLAQLRNWCCLFDKWVVKWIFARRCKGFHQCSALRRSSFSSARSRNYLDSSTIFVSKKSRKKRNKIHFKAFSK